MIPSQKVPPRLRDFLLQMFRSLSSRSVTAIYVVDADLSRAQNQIEALSRILANRASDFDTKSRV